MQASSNPCRNCTDRNVGCHATCVLYKNWKSGYDRDKDLYYESLARERMLTDVKIKSVKRTKKRK